MGRYADLFTDFNHQRTYNIVIKREFWSSLTGVLTAVAGLISAVAAIIGALYKIGVFNEKTEKTHPGVVKISPHKI